MLIGLRSLWESVTPPATGPAGADLSEWRRKTRYLGKAGPSLRETFEWTLAHPKVDKRSKEYRRLKEQGFEDDEMILLLVAIATLYD